MMRKHSILFLTDTLNSGGSERQLTELALRLDPTQFKSSVFYYAKGDFYRAKLEARQVQIYRVQRRNRVDFNPILKLARLLRSGEVDLIHAFADMPNLYAVIAKRMAGRGKVIASVRSASDIGRTMLQWRLKTWAHHAADLTISNNEVGLRLVASRAGLSASQIVCMRNGVDMEYFQPGTKSERETVRNALGIALEDLVFLRIGTFHWCKDYNGFINAISRISVPINWKFVWAGRSPDAELSAYLQAQIEKQGLQRNFILLQEPIEDVRNLYHAADVVVSNSLSEGTPNVVVEAMACGLPVIATDVGDSSTLAVNGKTGWLIPPNDEASLAKALCDAGATIPLERHALGEAGRRLITDLGMNIQSVVNAHEAAYLDVLAK